MKIIKKNRAALARPVRVEEVRDMIPDELDKVEAYKLARLCSDFIIKG